MSKAKTPSTKKTWRDSLPIDMLLSAVSVLVVAQSISEIPEGLMNNPVNKLNKRYNCVHLAFVPAIFKLSSLRSASHREVTDIFKLSSLPSASYREVTAIF